MIKAILGPKASLIQTYSPPNLGHLLDNSADINALGIKKPIAAIKNKPINVLPLAAMIGRLLRLATAIMFIIIIAKRDNTLLFFEALKARLIVVDVFPTPPFIL